MSSLADSVTDAWYNKKPWILILLPLSVVFWLIAVIRRLLYRNGVLRSTKVGVPVIVIGNITVGGTGKSPLTAYLVEALEDKGFRPGIISRGYGGHSEHYPLLVTGQSKPEHAGDEPVMLQQITGVPVVVDPERSSAAHYLIDHCGVDVVICDDGLQHYALSRDIEICVLDGQRGVGNGFMLPAGPLREPVSRFDSVDFIISNGESELVRQVVEKTSADAQNAPRNFEMVLKPADIINVFDGRVMALTELKEKPVHAVAGIGNPSRFFDSLSRLGATVIAHSYPDHHQYVRENITFGDDINIIMTQKDAVKCRGLYNGNEPENVWFLPVKAVIDERFLDQLCERISSKQ